MEMMGQKCPRCLCRGYLRQRGGRERHFKVLGLPLWYSIPWPTPACQSSLF